MFLLSVVGALYAFGFFIFIFCAHLVFIAQLRGSAIRLSDEQLPELYRRCNELCLKAGLRKIPEIYLAQADGSLNAFATSFLQTKFIVLFSDMLEACGDNEAARDMIIGHEIGHIKAGHLRWMFIDMPGMWIPFLGHAYSRACEYTCDRYGAALCGDLRGATLGLTILSAGKHFAPQVNIAALVNQQSNTNSSLMTIGRWLSGYPQISERIAQIDSSFGSSSRTRLSGATKALAMLLIAVGAPTIAVITFWNPVVSFIEAAIEEEESAEEPTEDSSITPEAAISDS